MATTQSTANVSADNLDMTQIKSLKEFLMSYNKLSNLCFIDCIDDMTSRKIKSDEERCVVNCAEKYLKVNQRISERFQEFQMLTNENALSTAGQKLQK